MVLDLIAHLSYYRLLAIFDGLVVELLDLSTLNTNDVIMMVAAFQLENRVTGLEMMPRNETRRFELCQDPVNGCETHVIAGFQQLSVNILRAQMLPAGGLQYLENLEPRQCRLQSGTLELLIIRRHGILPARDPSADSRGCVKAEYYTSGNRCHYNRVRKACPGSIAAKRPRGGPQVQLVILGRDGVINVDSGAAITSEHEWQAIPGSLEALARLNGAGYRVVVVSNQPGLRRRAFNVATLNSIHHKMQHELLEAGGGVDAVFFCACLPKDECECMMPSPGMLLEIASRLRISLEGVPVIGSTMATIEAARAAGAGPIFVRTGAGDDKSIAESREDLESYDNLAAAVDSLLAE